MKEPIWLSRQILMILHQEGLGAHGGLPGLRDPNLLDSALAKAPNRHAYEGEADVFRLATAYAAGIARNHPFADGNKRAAFIAAVTFLHLNGQWVDVPDGEAVAAMVDLASGELPEEGFCAWLRDRSSPRR